MTVSHILTVVHIQIDGYASCWNRPQRSGPGLQRTQFISNIVMTANMCQRVAVIVKVIAERSGIPVSEKRRFIRTEGLDRGIARKKEKRKG
jgi:hypothetical protein